MSRPSRGSADDVGDLAANGDVGRLMDELSGDKVVVISGSLFQGKGTDLLPSGGGGGRRSGGKTGEDGRRTLLRVGPASEAAAVIRDASIADVKIDRRRDAAKSRSRGDC